MSDFPPMRDLIPHAEPMVLLDDMTEWSSGEAACRMRVRDGDRFVQNGVLQRVSMIEHMAQAVAACLGYEAFRAGGGVRVGMIIGCRRCDFPAGHARVGDELCIRVRRVRGTEALSHFDSKILCGDTVLADATLTLYHADDIQP